MKISIIIPTFNRADIIPRAIKSVLAQTYKDYEIIVVDDGSVDETKQVVSQFPVKYFKLSENQGGAKTRNYGFLKSTGDYIVYLDDDNEFEPTFLEKAVYLLDHSVESCGGIRVGRTIIYNGFSVYAPPLSHTGYESIDWGFLMKREVMETIKWDETMAADIDVDFGIEYAKRFKTIPINEALTIAHAEYEKNSECYPTPKRLESLVNLLHKHLDFYKQNPNELRYIYRLAGRNFYRGGFKLKGFRYFILSFLAKPNWRTFKHLWFILFGWEVYDRFMTREEMKGAI